MAAAVCEVCGATAEVRVVGYSVGDQHRTALMCPECKQRRVVKRRVRHRADPGKYLRRHKLRRTLREGGVQAYIGFALLVLGVALLPLFVIVSLLLR